MSSFVFIECAEKGEGVIKEKVRKIEIEFCLYWHSHDSVPCCRYIPDLCVSFVTLIARIGTLSGVNAHVLGQRRFF
jgi:hypothetical protein